MNPEKRPENSFAIEVEAPYNPIYGISSPIRIGCSGKKRIINMLKKRIFLALPLDIHTSSVKKKVFVNLSSSETSKRASN